MQNLRLGTKIPLLSACLYLTGCLASVNLANSSSSLPASERRIASEIADKVLTHCVIVEHYGDNQPISERNIIQSAEIKRFYTSPTDWYKVVFTTQGVWGEGFYNDRTKMFICGERSWLTYSNSREIFFTEFGLTPKSLPPPTKAKEWVTAYGPYGQTWINGNLIMEITYNTAQDCADSINYEINNSRQLIEAVEIQQTLSFFCARTQTTTRKRDEYGLLTGGLSYSGKLRFKTSRDEYPAWFLEKNICESIRNDLNSKNTDRYLICP
jgi:hypothetical protein